MSVCNIGSRNCRKCRLNGFCLCRIIELPHSVADAVIRYKIIESRFCLLFCYDGLQGLILSVSQENRACLGIYSIYVADTVYFLVFSAVPLMIM